MLRNLVFILLALLNESHKFLVVRSIGEAALQSVDPFLHVLLFGVF